MRRKVTSQVLLWTILFVSMECDIKMRNTEASLLTKFVKSFIPFIKLKLSNDTPVQFRHSPVEKAIGKLVQSLRIYLQDDDIGNITTHAADDTMIIDVDPKTILREGNITGVLETNIHVFEIMKSDIKAALEKEAVSEQTRRIVANALDHLINQVIGNQCNWKSHSDAVFRNRKDMHNTTMDERDDMRMEYINLLKSKHMNKSIMLFHDFHRYFKKVINDTHDLSKYKIKCHLVRINKTKAQNRDSCDFKICSGELKDFLMDFYISLNDTAVTVFENYAAMYSRDVANDDSQENDPVPKILNNLQSAVVRRISKVYLKELAKLSLDKNKDKEANIKMIKDFVRVTTKGILNHLNKHITTDLASLRTRLLLAIKQDISTNLDVELGNLSEDFQAKICSAFVDCNGKVKIRRVFDISEPKIDRDSVYVKIQLSLNDRLKEDLARGARGFGKYKKADTKNTHSTMDIRKYTKRNVTRTTVGVEYTTNVISKLISHSGNEE